MAVYKHMADRWAGAAVAGGEAETAVYRCMELRR
jgi:hypothetical protein